VTNAAGFGALAPLPDGGVALMTTISVGLQHSPHASAKRSLHERREEAAQQGQLTDGWAVP